MKKRKTGTILTMALCILGVLGGAGSVVAAAEAPVLKRVLKTGEPRVGLSGAQPPMNAKSRTGEIIGLEPELATLLAGAFGVEPKFVEKPFPELLTSAPPIRKSIPPVQASSAVRDGDGGWRCGGTTPWTWRARLMSWPRRRGGGPSATAQGGIQRISSEANRC